MNRCVAATLLCTLALLNTACGDDTGVSASATSIGPGPGTSTSTTGGTATGPTTGAPPTTSGSDSDSATTTTSTTTTTTGEPPTSTSNGVKFDVGVDDVGESCRLKCGNTDWSYVWIANSGEHTISKLNTRDMTEEGRYITRADQLGNPSRTSVSIDGKAVVVANRSGGITKIWARPEYCEDKNGNGTIETSTGAGDVLPWGQDECIAWYTDFPGATTQRPVAWTSGTYNPRTCEYEDQKIWTAASFGASGIGSPCDGADGVHVYRLDGVSGAVEDEVHLPDVTCGALGAYGAAVDFDNNVWMFVFGGGLIFRVDHETLEHTVVYKGFYGITVDTKSRVWLDDGSRYDPVTQTWATQIGDLQPNGGSGVVQDLKGRIWHATQGGIGWVDPETMMVGGKVTLPNPGLARGIGVDVDGYIWAVILGGTVAYRIHPDTFEIAEYNGLNQPYTYSDMAGGQINNVTCNPQG
ncbi:hypothetical protein [Nannocystis punicea]|uniref:Uncharacterized protein n=1 Tax=Nannocystis punicea TaxID=2995304 RepID=A0ABY7HCT2_9BACT|nr:hypothetical protein [Nannocystis poenicansa]WAS96804.1 hypothetical protein O0S08_11710 [Nannocystis poenicansa]